MAQAKECPKVLRISSERSSAPSSRVNLIGLPTVVWSGEHFDWPNLVTWSLQLQRLQSTLFALLNAMSRPCHHAVTGRGRWHSGEVISDENHTSGFCFVLLFCSLPHKYKTYQLVEA